MSASARTPNYVETSFGRIAYDDAGSGPAALFVHGLPLSGYQWRHVLPLVSDLRRCIAVDQMGLGQSEIAKDEDLSFAAQAANLAEVIAALDLGPVDLVGNDTGAGICQMLMASRPDLVRTLTLTNCEVHDLWPNALLTGFYEGMASGGFAEALAAMVAQPALAEEQVGSLVYEKPQSASPEIVATCFAPIVSSDRRKAQFQRLANWQPSHRQLMDAAPKFKASEIPAQIVWGMADPVFEAEASVAWLEANLGGLSKVTRLPDAKLFFPEERPEALAACLHEHWQAHG